MEMFLNYNFAIGFLIGFLTGLLNLWAARQIFIRFLRTKATYLIWWFLKFSALVGLLLVLILLIKIDALGILLGLVLTQIFFRFKFLGTTETKINHRG